MSVKVTESFPMTWEESVAWLRKQPDKQDIVKACFYDDPLDAAAARFHTCAEWSAVRELLPKPSPGDAALDLGSGRGIAAYALAKDGWRVTALEPDPSNLVGAGAIRELMTQTGLGITVVEEWGEKLPFGDASFDLVHARQVLHHARDLRALCSEMARVLRPGGVFIASREHVISCQEDLSVFLDAHPLHHLYGGENAFTLDAYLSSLRAAGLQVEQTIGPWDTDINLYPLTIERIRESVIRAKGFPWPGLVPKWLIRFLGRRLRSPGSLYTFLGSRP